MAPGLPRLESTPMQQEGKGTERLQLQRAPCSDGLPREAALMTQLSGVPSRAFQVMSIELIFSLTISIMYVPYLKKKKLYANTWIVKQGKIEIAVCIVKG